MGWLGASLITSFTDTTKEANLCLANYAELRDSVLEETGWSFATKRVKLATLASPELGYSYAYQLPSDCIRMLHAHHDETFNPEDAIDYVVEDRKVLTDNGALYIKYIKQIIDPNWFSPNFRQALAYRIASELAIPLTRSRELQLQMTKMYQLRLTDAKATDGMQSRSQQVTVPWVNRRR